jgi:hypothetical protein
MAYMEPRNANPGASSMNMTFAYRVALLKAKVKKGGTNLGEVGLSLLSGTDAEEDNGEDSDASDDNTKALRDDLERRNQVTPPSSPLQNKYLTGLMKSREKRQADAQAKQAQDEGLPW